MVGKYANQNPDQNLSQTLPKTFCKPLKHTNKKVCDEGANQPITHNKEASALAEGYRLNIIRKLATKEQGYLLPARSEEDKSTEE